MTLIDQGRGATLTIVPGVQGRWEWHTRGIAAIARRCRVLTFSLADEPGSGTPFNEHDCIGSYCAQILEALSQAHVESTTLCGISYGGLVAAAFAARHPEKVSALILVSALPPGWRPDRRVGLYLRAPRLLTPVFLVNSLRLFSEIRTASPDVSRAIARAGQHAWNALRHMFSPTRMARRVENLCQVDLTKEIQTIAIPTLIIVGEPHLDRVVPVAATLEYQRLIPHARTVTLARTGHLGSVTRPDDFARLVVPFVEQFAHHSASRRQLG
jgi:pimeloyl-ACP methyl ester carboxylesterase